MAQIAPIDTDEAGKIYREMMQIALSGHQSEMAIMEARIKALEKKNSALVEEIRRYTRSQKK